MVHCDTNLRDVTHLARPGGGLGGLPYAACCIHHESRHRCCVRVERLGATIRTVSSPVMWTASEKQSNLMIRRSVNMVHGNGMDEGWEVAVPSQKIAGRLLCVCLLAVAAALRCCSPGACGGDDGRQTHRLLRPHPRSGRAAPRTLRRGDGHRRARALRWDRATRRTPDRGGRSVPGRCLHRAGRGRARRGAGRRPVRRPRRRRDRAGPGGLPLTRGAVGWTLRPRARAGLQHRRGRPVGPAGRRSSS